MAPAEPVADVKAARRRPGLLLVQRLEDVLDGPAGDLVVADVVPELRELVEDDRVRVAVKLGALVVDLLDVGLRARACG